jgi:hypothetical protein
MRHGRQRRVEQRSRVVLIVDDEHLDALQQPAGAGRPGIGGVTARRRCVHVDLRRQMDLELGARLSFVAECADGAAVELDEPFGDREAQPEPALLPARASIRLTERLEDVGQEFGIDAVARVAHGDHETLAPFERDRHLAFRRREFDRIGEQVPDDLLQAIGVAHGHRRPYVQPGHEPDSLCRRRRLHDFHRRRDDRGEVDVGDAQSQLSGDDAGDLEQVLDETRLRARVAFDALQCTRLRGLVHGRGAEHPRPPEHRVQWRAQLVGERREEFVLQPVGISLPFQRRDAFAFDAAALLDFALELLVGP